MDLITTWADTGPAWLGGIGGVIAALIAGYALYRAIRSEARHVEWQLSNEPKPDGRRSENWRLINGTSGVRARVLGFENTTGDGLQDALRGDLILPAVVEPSGWLPFNHSRSLSSGYPTVIRVTWQEGPSGRRFRQRRFSAIYYLN